MSRYEARYEKQFVRNLERYAALRERIKQRVERVLDDPYAATEFLADRSGIFASFLSFVRNAGRCQRANTAFATTCLISPLSF